MIGLLGSLRQLGEEGLLDCIMYLSGVSGSTWCMSSVYKEPDWSTKMKKVEKNIIQRLVRGHVSNTEQYKKLKKTYKRDNFSVTDIWAAFVVSRVVKEIDEHPLTGQRGKHTRDPYPIYTVIDKECKDNDLCKDVWFEITPDECGYSITGAFVDSTTWGSRFEYGAVTKKQPENDMLSLQGLCGSALADWEKNMKYICVALRNIVEETFSEQGHFEMLKDYQKVLYALLDLNDNFFRGEDITSNMNTINELLKGKRDKEGHEVKLQGTITDDMLTQYNIIVCDNLPDWFPELNDLNKQELTYSGLSSDLQVNSVGFWRRMYTCMKKLWQWDWGTTYNFLYNMEVPDVNPSILKSETRQYIDAGLLENSPYFSVLRTERNIDLIISLDFSDGDPFKTVDKAAAMCAEMQIPFPTIQHPGNDQEPDDFYVFEDNPTAPTVIHIPLFNAGNCKGEVEKWKKKYRTFQLSYSEEMIKDLLDKACENITNTKQKLLDVISELIRKKH
ncbi:cytosolic phospholipase A2 gamma-like isoform X2 [Brachyhypopomus gauderio]